MHNYRFSLDYLPDADKYHSQGHFCFFEGNQLVEVGSQSGVMSTYEDLKLVTTNHIDSPIYIGGYQDRHYFAQELQQGTSEAEGLPSRTMRQLGGEDATMFALLARGLQLLNWRRGHKFCGHCGSPTENSNTEYALRCGNCQASFYPKIMPCIMALVTRGDQCLLAKHTGRGRASTFYSALAGFIEAGESVEHAIHREVMEEVGIKVGNIRYFSSQAWPFPGQLMLAYYAEYLEGEIVPEEGEIEDARWFNPDELPDIPEAFSLSGQLIRNFAESKGN